ncbi:MAG: hypothetical protein IJE49_09685 [Agathobacter sp.]|nr:hypothetical protein [Agathobacter sp.]
MTIQGIDYTSCCINPNTRQLTSNRNNTAWLDKDAAAFMCDKLRPIHDIAAALDIPLNLADETFIDKVNNELYIAEGSHFTFDGGFVYTVLEKGITCGYGTQEEWNGEVPLPGDASNETLNRAAQAMAGAIVRLLRDATGTVDESMLGQKKHIQFHQDVCKVLDYFGLDSSRDFSINGVKYTRDEDGLFRSEKSYAAQEAYEVLRNNNRSYALADESTKKRVHYMSDYYLASAPEEVRKAWQETLEETGINPFQSGYVSTLQQLATEQDFATGGNDQIFGDSIESSIEAIDKILKRIANPKHSEKEDYVSSMVPAEQEIEVFLTLQRKLINGETNQDSISNERVIGMTMIPYNDNVSYGVIAKYAEESTADNPVIEVISNRGGEKAVYKVNVNEVDPNNATMLEMFALLSYADDQGLSTPSSFSSFQELKVYAMNAAQNGYCASVESFEDFVNLKMDWTKPINEVGQDYMEAGISEQYNATQALLDFLQKNIEEMQANIEAGNVDFEPAFQIGGKAYTQEEWDKLLEYVDEVEEETQEAMEVEQAMKEAAEETGYEEEGQMDYLSQAFIKKVENLVNGVENPSDIFGSIIESTLQAAQELLFELENPLTPASARGENAIEYMEKEKAYYRALIERLKM